MTTQEYEIKLEKIKQKNRVKELRLKLKKEKEKYGFKISKLQTTKIIVVYLFVLLNAIVVYSMCAMWHFGDLSYLSVLISDIAAQVIVFGIYAIKAYFGKKQEEQIKFERDKIGILDFSEYESTLEDTSIIEDVEGEEIN